MKPPPKFFTFIKTIYTDLKVVLKIDKKIREILQSVGIHQGNNMAPVLFLFLDNAAWAICFTHHTVLKASPGVAIFGWDMLFDIPFIADWNKIEYYRQHQTDLSTACENKKCVDYDNKVGDRVLVVQDGIICKAQSPHGKEPVS